MTTRAGGETGPIASAGTDSPAETEPRTGIKAATAQTRLRYTLPGAWLALVFACLSFTPSLLPRSALAQGVLCGIAAVIGYGLGVVGAWVWREFANGDARPAKRRSWRIFVVAATVLVVLSFLLGQRWQGQIRDLMGAPADSPFLLVLTPIAAAIVFGLSIAIGRGLRWVSRWVARQLSRWIGPRAARATGWLVVAVVTVLLVTGMLFDGAISFADGSFGLSDRNTPEGIEQPDSPLRSGSPSSLIEWDSLGRQGRTFTGSGPTVERISAYNGSPGTEPIRIYAGSASAGEPELRAQLAVRDLERAGGFSRAYLMVATTTGTGWLDPSAVDSFEYITGGDSAIIAMQYSYLPSWLSYFVDQRKAREAGRGLFDAVYDRWSKLPTDSRPKLIVFGESLGSFGGETAFSGEYDLANRTDGALFTGPPGFSTLYREFTDGRDGGSPEVEPVYRAGRTVRFTNDAGDDIPPASQAWDGTRVLYAQHPSDPIVWWSPDLLFRMPDWLGESRGHDVLDEMVWMPFVTFWQVTVDLPVALNVPAGHGHRYGAEHVDAWAAVLQPDDWTSDKAAQLRQLIELEQDES